MTRLRRLLVFLFLAFLWALAFTNTVTDRCSKNMEGDEMAGMAMEQRDFEPGIARRER